MDIGLVGGISAGALVVLGVVIYCFASRKKKVNMPAPAVLPNGSTTSLHQMFAHAGVPKYQHVS